MNILSTFGKDFSISYDCTIIIIILDSGPLPVPQQARLGHSPFISLLNQIHTEKKKMKFSSKGPYWKERQRVTLNNPNTCPYLLP